MNLSTSIVLQLLMLVGLLILLSWYAVGCLIGYLVKQEMVDLPNHRTLHQGAIPRGGGLVIITGLVISLLFAAALSGRPMLFGVFALLLVGWSSLSWYDDAYELSAKLRLFVQLVICVISVFSFGWVSQVHGPNLFSLPLFYFGPILTIIGLVWMANLYNFMDGLDGLAASQTIVASVTLAFWFFMFGDNALALVLLCLSAVSYGFLIWNWNPAKVFMGDVGSIGLGGFFGLIFIIGVTRYDVSILSFFSLFAVFIVDSTITISMRALRREKIWQPHKKHYYQRLANIGYPHTYIALAELTLMIICSSLATFGLIYHDMIVLSIIAILILLTICIALLNFLERRRNRSLDSSDI